MHHYQQRNLPLNGAASSSSRSSSASSSMSSSGRGFENATTTSAAAEVQQQQQLTTNSSSSPHFHHHAHHQHQLHQHQHSSSPHNNLTASHVFLLSHSHDSFKNTDRMSWFYRGLYSKLKMERMQTWEGEASSSSELHANRHHSSPPSSPVVTNSATNSSNRRHIHVVNIPSHQRAFKRFPILNQKQLFVSSSASGNYFLPAALHGAAGMQHQPSSASLSPSHRNSNPTTATTSSAGNLRSFSSPQSSHANGSGANSSTVSHRSRHSSSSSSTSATELSISDAFQQSYMLTPLTRVHTLYTRYKLVFSIDISPSMMVIDPSTGEVAFDRVYLCVEEMLRGLAKEFVVSPLFRYVPIIHLSIIAVGSVQKPVLPVVQDLILNEATIEEAVEIVRTNIQHVEYAASEAYREWIKHKRGASSWYKSDFNILVENSLVPFDFLPPEACPVLVIITDGVFTLSNLKTDTINRLAHSDTTFNIVNISNPDCVDYNFCYIPNTDLMEFVVKATGGTLINYSFFHNSSLPFNDHEDGTGVSLHSGWSQPAALFSHSTDPREQQERMLAHVTQRRSRLLQEALLLKHNYFHNSQAYSGDYHQNNQFSLERNGGNDLPSGPIMRPSMRSSGQLPSKGDAFGSVDKFQDYELRTNRLDTLLKLRISQGFVVDRVKFQKKRIETSNEFAKPETVHLRFLFRPNVHVEYVIKMSRETGGSTSRRHASSNEGSFHSHQFSAVKVLQVEIYLHSSKTFLEQHKKASKRIKSKNTKPVDAISKHLLDFISTVKAQDKAAEKLHSFSEQGVNYLNKRYSNTTFSIIKNKFIQEHSAWFSEDNIPIVIQIPDGGREFVMRQMVPKTHDRNFSGVASNKISMQATLSSPSSTATDRSSSKRGSPVSNSSSQTGSEKQSHSHSEHVLDSQQLTVNQITQFLDSCSSARVKEGTFITFLKREDSRDYSNFVTVKRDNERSLELGFCILKLTWHSMCVASLKLRFFNIPREQRSTKKLEIINGLKQIENVSLESRGLVQVFSRLPSNFDDLKKYYAQLYHRTPHYTSYMHHKKWLWPLTENSASISSILTLLFAKRLKEGFQVVSRSENSAIFLKKFPLQTISSKLQECTLFYSAHYAHHVDQIITEYWLEPLCGVYDNSQICPGEHFNERELRSHIEHHFAICDADIISLFCTYDTIFHECYKASPSRNTNVVHGSDTQSVNSMSRDITAIPFNLPGLWKRSTRHAISFPLLESPEDDEQLLRRLHNIVHLTNSVEISTKGVAWENDTTENKDYSREDTPTTVHSNADAESRRPFSDLSSESLSTLRQEEDANSFTNNVNSDQALSSQESLSAPPSPASAITAQSVVVPVPPMSFCRTAKCYARIVGESNSRFFLTFVPTTLSSENPNSVCVVVCECSPHQFFSLNVVREPENRLAFFANSSSQPLLDIVSESDFDDSYYHYQHFLREIHAHSFTYGLFKSMQRHPTVPLPVLKESVESCVEYSVDIDLSELVESILLSKDYFYTTVAEYECPHDEMSKYFEYLIKKHFMQPEHSEYHFVLREKPDKNASTILSSSNLCLNEFEDVGEDLSQSHDSSRNLSDSDGMLSPHSERLDIITKKSDFFSDTSSNSYTVHQELLNNATKSIALPAFFRMECRVSTPSHDFPSSPFSMNGFSSGEHVHKFPTANIPIEKALHLLLTDQHLESSDQWLRQQLGASANSSTLKLVLISLPPDKFQLVENNCEPQDTSVIRNMFNSHESNRFAYCSSRFEFSSHEENSMEDEIEESSGNMLDIAYLPPNLRKLMLRTKRKIQALISKEIINCCLHTSPLSTYILEKVKHHLQNLPPQCYGTTPYELKFVDPVQGPTLFDTELTKYENDKIKVLKLGSDYVIKMKRSVNQRPSYYAWHDQYLNDDDYKVNKEEIRHSASHPDLLGSDDLILSPDGTSSEEIFTSKEGEVSADIFDSVSFVEETPYWLIMSVRRKVCSVLFYSPFPITQAQRVFIHESIEQIISDVNNRVNTLILLNDLHETRICSDMLLPPSSEDLQLFKDMEMSHYDKENSEEFEPGTFKCSLVHQLSVGLHSRLSADLAMKQLGKTVFFSFEVLNRHNVYVCRERNGRVFYIRLAEHKNTHEDYTTLLVQNKPVSLSRVGHLLCVKKIDEMSEDTSSRLTIEVYGVDPPSSKITEQLMDSVKSKLSTLNLEILSDLLSKNRRFKLTLSDVEYLRPLDTPGDAIAYATIPAFVEHKFLFMLFLRQNMSYLNQLRLELSPQGETDLGYHSPSHEDDEEDFPSGIDFKALYFSFLYNFKTFERITNEASIGQGVACIHLTPVNMDKEIIMRFPVDKGELQSPLSLDWPDVQPRKEVVNWNDRNVYPLPLQEIEPEFPTSQGDAEEMESGNTSNTSPRDTKDENTSPRRVSTSNTKDFQLLFEIWAKGEVNAEALIDRLVLSINHTLFDYLLELHLFSHELFQSNIVSFLESFDKLTKRAADLQSPSISRTSFHIFLPKWILSEFVDHIFSIIKEFEPSLRTKLFELDAASDDISAPLYAIVGGRFAPRKLQSQENSNEFSQIAFHGSTQFLYGKSLRFVRNCCVAITVSTTNLTIVTYNMRRSRSEDLHGRLNRYMSFTKCRQLLLNSILHQKLGLFYHSTQRNLSSLIDVQDQVTTKQNLDFKLNLRDIDTLLHSNMKLTTKSKRQAGFKSQQALSLKNRPHLQRRKGPHTDRALTSTSTRKKNVSTNKPFNLLLKGIYDSESEVFTPPPAIEPLKFHGRQFKHTIAKNHQETVEKSRVSRIYNGWGKSSMTPANALSKLTPKDLAIIKKTSRLFHFCRTPLFFNEIRQMVFDPSTLDNIVRSQDVDAQYRRELALHVQLQRSFLQEYSQYLRQHLDIKESLVVNNDSSNSCFLQVDGQTFYSTKISVYFQKIIHGGVMLLELSFESAYCSLNLYVSDLYERRNQYKVGLSSQKQSRIQFLQHTAQVKHDLHLNSFLYDFHVRKFYQYIVHPDLEQFPSMNIVDVLNDFEQFHKSPPIYSRNMLAFVRLEETIEIPRDASTKQFFTYIRRHADYFSVGIKKYRQIGNAIVIPESDNLPGSDYRYCAVVTLSDARRNSSHDGTGELLTRSLVLKSNDLLSAYQEEVNLQLDIHLLCLKDSGPCHPVHSEMEKDALGELVKQIRERVIESINELVRDTLILFRLDILWQLSYEKKISAYYFSQLIVMCKRTDVSDIFDSSLSYLSMARDIPWHILLPAYCKRNALSFQLKTEEGLHHLVILNRECPHIFLDVEYHVSDNQISMYLCEKSLSDVIYEDLEGDKQQYLYEDDVTTASNDLESASGQESSSDEDMLDLLQDRKRAMRMPSQWVCSMVDHFVNEICAMSWEFIVRGRIEFS